MHRGGVEVQLYLFTPVLYRGIWSMRYPRHPWEKAPIPIVGWAGWDQELVWTF